MITKRAEAICALYQNRLYVFGGFNINPVIEKTNEYYNISTNKWTKIASFPAGKEVTHQGIILVDDNIWLIGGRAVDSHGPATSQVIIYNITTNTWSNGPSIKNPATGATFALGGGGYALLGRTIHVFGGFGPTMCADQANLHLTIDVDQYMANRQTVTWENKSAPMPIPRNHFSYVTLAGKIYALGGQFQHDCGALDQKYCHVYDPVTDKWTRLTDLPIARSHAEGSTFAVDGKIYMAAGQGVSDLPQNTVYQFDPKANNNAGAWTTLASYTPLPGKFLGLCAKVYGNTLVINSGALDSYDNSRAETYTASVSRTNTRTLGFSTACISKTATGNQSITAQNLLYSVEDATTYSLTSNAPWLRVTKNRTGTVDLNGTDIEVTANSTGLPSGTYTGTITASGSSLVTPATFCFTLTVSSNNNLPPILGAIGNKSVVVGMPLTFTATSTDEPAQTNSFSLVNPPSGAVINSQSGAFSWTPMTTGTFPLTVKVTDNGTPALSDEEPIMITVSNPPPNTAFAINSGGPYFDASGDRHFVADMFYGGVDRTGSLASGDILNTTDDALYLTERSASSFNYSIPISSGNVKVVLHFAEIWFGVAGRGAGGVGKRQFNVDIEGARKLTNYDIFAKSGGALRAIQETIPVTVLDGMLNINFMSGAADLPKISAIEIIPIPNNPPVIATIGDKTDSVGQALSFVVTATDDPGQTDTFSLVDPPEGASIDPITGVFNWTPTIAGIYPITIRVIDNDAFPLWTEQHITVTVTEAPPPLMDPIRLNAGGPAYTAGDGRQFLKDTYYGGTDRVTSITNVDIANTTDDALYRTERSAAAFNYAIPVTNGSMNVVLHFAEIWFGISGRGPAGVGRRAFNVDIEGTRVLTNYDIYAKTGGPLRAITETIPVTVSDGFLNIVFSVGTADWPKISAIEVVPVDNSGARVSQLLPETIIEEKSEKSIVYPNPARDHFTVEYAPEFENLTELQLVNSSGKSFAVSPIEDEHFGSKSEIDVSKLSLTPGTYILRLQSAEKSENIKILITE